MRRLINIIILIVIVMSGWLLFQHQTKTNKNLTITFGVSLPLSGSHASIGLAAQDALNLALKERNNRQNRYKYRIFYLDDSGNAEQTQKNLQSLIDKQKASALITLWTPSAKKAMLLANKFRRLHFTCAIGNGLSDGKYNFNHYLSYHTDNFTDKFQQTTGKSPSSCTSNLYDALKLLILAYEDTPPDWRGNIPSAERVSRNLHKIFNHDSASGNIYVAPDGRIQQTTEKL